MEKKLVFVGKSCSGKSTIANMLKDCGFKIQISTTSRPKRNYEIDDIDYHFITKEEFENMIKKQEFIEIDSFNGWYYGLTHKDFEQADILILTPRGLKKYLEIMPKENFLIIYIETSISLKKKRIDFRKDTHDDVGRRWMNDDIDFEGWDQWGAPWDLKVSIQSNDAIPELMELILLKMKKVS